MTSNTAAFATSMTRQVGSQKNSILFTSQFYSPHHLSHQFYTTLYCSIKKSGLFSKHTLSDIPPPSMVQLHFLPLSVPVQILLFFNLLYSIEDDTKEETLHFLLAANFLLKYSTGLSLCLAVMFQGTTGKNFIADYTKRFRFWLFVNGIKIFL